MAAIFQIFQIVNFLLLILILFFTVVMPYKTMLRGRLNNKIRDRSHFNNVANWNNRFQFLSDLTCQRRLFPLECHVTLTGTFSKVIFPHFCIIMQALEP